MNRKLFKINPRYKRIRSCTIICHSGSLHGSALIRFRWQDYRYWDPGRKSSLHYQDGVILVIMAMLALWFGVKAGTYAMKLAQDTQRTCGMTYFTKVPGFSFKNIDHFPISLVARMTTDVTNVQMAYMMSIRLLAGSAKL